MDHGGKHQFPAFLFENWELVLDNVFICDMIKQIIAPFRRSRVFFLQESSDGQNWKSINQSSNLTKMLYELGGYRDAAQSGLIDADRYRIINESGRVIRDDTSEDVL